MSGPRPTLQPPSRVRESNASPVLVASCSHSPPSSTRLPLPRSLDGATALRTPNPMSSTAQWANQQTTTERSLTTARSGVTARVALLVGVRDEPRLALPEIELRLTGRAVA